MLFLWFCSLLPCHWQLYWDFCGFPAAAWLDLSDHGAAVIKRKCEKLENVMENDLRSVHLDL